MQGRNRTTEVAVETYRVNKRALPAAVATPVPDCLSADPSRTKYTISYFPVGRGAIVGVQPFPLSRRAG